MTLIVRIPPGEEGARTSFTGTARPFEPSQNAPTASARVGRSLLLDANATSRIEPYPLKYDNDSIKHNQIDIGIFLPLMVMGSEETVT